MIRDDRVEEYRQKGLQESLKELEDLMAELVTRYSQSLIITLPMLTELLHFIQYSEGKLDQFKQPGSAQQA